MPKEMRVMLCGNEASGKTTFLYQLKLGELITTIPTIGISHFIFYYFFFSTIQLLLFFLPLQYLNTIYGGKTIVYTNNMYMHLYHLLLFC